MVCGLLSHRIRAQAVDEGDAGRLISEVSAVESDHSGHREYDNTDEEHTYVGPINAVVHGLASTEVVPREGFGQVLVERSTENRVRGPDENVAGSVFFQNVGRGEDGRSG